MPIQVTRTKVILPRRRPDLLTRQRLLELLYNLLDYKVIIVTAPAGYGKTSLLVDFAHQAEMPVCWFAIDALDRDLLRFLTHFFASIANRFPSFGEESTAILESVDQGTPFLDRLVTTVVNDIYEHIREHFFLVLDDFHLVGENKEIESFINRFVQEMGENCHLVLTSRCLPTLPDMPLLVARSQVGGLSFEELAFQSGEIKALVYQNYRVAMPDAAADELVSETEGWITGLLLSAQTMWQGMADRLRVARVSGIGLYDYLAQQVLEQQPPTIRRFLLRTSLLEEFDLELCSTVFGAGEDLPSLIEAVLQNNLFILPVGEDGRWIRYHHLFRDFLQSRLDQELPGERERILSRLVDVFADRGDWDNAYAACQQLGDMSAIVRLVEQAGTFLVKNGRLAALAQWIDALPDGVEESRPKLLSLRGSAALMQGQVDQGLALLDRAERELRSSGDYWDLAVTLARRSTAHRFLGNYSLSMSDSSEALSLIELQDAGGFHPAKAEALRARGMCLYQLGSLDDAVECLNRSLEVYQALQDRPNVALVWMELGLVWMGAGRYRQALSGYRQADEYWSESNNLAGRANVLNNLGVLYHLTGDYSESIYCFEKALSCAVQSGYLRLEAYVLCGIGDLYSDLEADDAALDAYRRSREIARQMDDRFLLLYVCLAEAAQARRKGEFYRAESELESAFESLEESTSTYEQGLWKVEAGRLMLAKGEPDKAVEVFERAAQLFERGGQAADAARANMYLAVVYDQLDGVKTAAAQMNKAFRQVAHLESQHILVAAGKDAKALLVEISKDAGTGNAAAELLERVEAFERRIPALRRQLRPKTSTIPFAPPKLVIQSLGWAQVELDGKPVTVPEWQNQKRVREFFFYLLAHPHGLTKEEVGLVFWPDSSPAQLKLQFKNLIYRLRCGLGPEVVLFDEDRYWFNRDIDYVYDVEALFAHLAGARAAASPEEALDAYTAAANLYRGDYLPEMSGNWVLPERERLWQAYLEASLSIGRLHFEAGRFNEVISSCQKLLAADPCLEDAHRLAMRAYDAAGNRAAVTRQFERCRQAIWQEISSPPSLQTEQLYQALMH